MDFDRWWNQVEIFAGEGAMGAAEQAWDYQQAEIDELKCELTILLKLSTVNMTDDHVKRVNRLLAKHKGE